MLPKIPAWETFPLGMMPDWCASKRTLESQFIQGLTLLLNVEIREWGWEIETKPQDTIPIELFQHLDQGKNDKTQVLWLQKPPLKFLLSFTILVLE